jgi:Tol biopolymer transport system component
MRTRCTSALLAALSLALAACGAPETRRAEAPASGRVDTTFRDPQRVTIRGYDGDAMEPFLTRDGRYLLFNNSNDPRVNTDLHVARAVDGLTFEYQGALRGVNTDALEGVPTLDRSGTLYFVSTRSYATTLSTIYRGQLASGTVRGVELVPGLPRRRGIVLFDVEVSADGAALYYASGVFRGRPAPESADLAIARRRGAAFEPWDRSAEILATVNTPAALEYAASLSADGRELFFTRARGSGAAIYRAMRPNVETPFGPAVRVAAIRGFAEAPTLSPDGRSLYYHARAGGRFAIFRVTRAGRP